MDDEALLAALNISGIGSTSLRTLPPTKLRFALGVKIECLHGRHRIIAARRALPPVKIWWTVDLYGNGSCMARQRTVRLKSNLAQVLVTTLGRVFVRAIPSRSTIRTEKTFARSAMLS